MLLLHNDINTFNKNSDHTKFSLETFINKLNLKKG